ncbi:MAG TPA: hypothetical protein VMN35_06980 [Gaiellaceae bacterium]|nr:hypothetical protein [Gaiellaceae bacterium]
MDRGRACLAATPVVAAGVLVAHAAAYRLTGTPTGSAHAYLAHAPQVLLALAVVGAALAAFTHGPEGPAAWVFVLAALGAFAGQEHLEAVAHSGQLPFLLDSPAFVLGLVLQLPFAVGAWLLVRVLLSSSDESFVRRPQLPRALRAIQSPPVSHVRAVAVRPLPGRGPPALLRR